MPDEKRIISKSKLDAIAGAIREKTGSDSTYTPDQMVTAIGAIKTQGDYQEKTFTENGTYTPDAGYDAFSQVTVNVQSTGSNPLQDMLDRSSDTNATNLFYVYDDSNAQTIFSLLTYENLIALDFSNKHYTNTSYMFNGCTSLTTVPLLDLSEVTTTSSMFSGCSSLTTVPLFDLSKATTTSYMFFHCTSLTTVPLFDLSKVSSIQGMFNTCTSLTTVPLFDLSSATDTSSMFYDCRNLTSVPLFDLSSATDTSYMFSGCSSLTTVPLFDLSKVKNMTAMFRSCTSLTTIPQLDFSNVTSAGNMFQQCYNLTTIPQLNFSSVTSTSYMFDGCKKLTTLDFSNIKKISSYFANLSKLSTLIIRNPTTLAVLDSTTAFRYTPIASGTGYIYVPDDLVDSYKQATNWSTFAAQIKPLSELPQGE